MGFGIVSGIRIAAGVRLKISAKVRDSALRLGSGLMHKMKDGSRMQG